jgi:hypothetical protein
MGTRDYPITDDERRWIKAWKECGGSQYGPNVEHVDIPYEIFFDFCRRLESAERSRVIVEISECESIGDAMEALRKITA